MADGREDDGSERRIDAGKNFPKAGVESGGRGGYNAVFCKVHNEDE
jgi:hypothetical protein